MKNRLTIIALTVLALAGIPSCASSRDAGPILPSDPSIVDPALFPQVDPQVDEQVSIGDRVFNALSRVNIAGEIRDGMLCGRATVLGVGPEICIGFVPRFGRMVEPDPTPSPPLEPTLAPLKY